MVNISTVSITIKERKVFSFLKKLFHKHNIVYTSRKLISHGTKTSCSSVCVELDRTNIYLIKGYCIKCKKRFVGKQEIIELFDKKQPYDK